MKLQNRANKIMKLQNRANKLMKLQNRANSLWSYKIEQTTYEVTKWREH